MTKNIKDSESIKQMDEVINIIHGAMKSLAVPVALLVAAFLLSRGESSFIIIFTIFSLCLAAFCFAVAALMVGIFKISELNLSTFYFLSVGLLFMISYVVFPISAFYLAVRNLA